MVFAPLPSEWMERHDQIKLIMWICGICSAWFCGFIVMGIAVWWRCYQTGDRIHWYEIHELDRCPKFLKTMARLYLKVGWDAYGFGPLSGSLARSVGVTLFETLCQYGWISHNIKSSVNHLHLVDLCAGGGGPSTQVHRSIQRKVQRLISDEIRQKKKQRTSISITDNDRSELEDENLIGNNNRELKINTILTDLFPVPSQWQQLVDRNPDISLHYCSDQVNALNIGNANILEQFIDSANENDDNNDSNDNESDHSLVVRTIYGSFHHFTPYQTIQLVSDAMYHGHGFFMVEPMLGRSSPFEMILMLLTIVVPSPFATLAICVELLNDRNVSLMGRLMNCILAIITMPVTISILFHDGIISCARTYSVEQLAELTKLAEIDAQKRLDKERRSSQMQLKDYDFEINDSEYARLMLLSHFGVGRMTVFLGLPRRKGIIPQQSGGND